MSKIQAISTEKKIYVQYTYETIDKNLNASTGMDCVQNVMQILYWGIIAALNKVKGHAGHIH